MVLGDTGGASSGGRGGDIWSWVTLEEQQVSHKCLEFNARPRICYIMSSASKLASVVKRAHVVCNDLDSAYI